MRKNSFIQHYNDKHASFQLYFKRTFEKQEVEDIHQLRLTIKKMRATWSLMDLISHGRLNKKLFFALFSKLFDEAGEVREAQVSLSMIEKSNANYLVPYAEYLREIQKLHMEKLLSTMNEFDFKIFEILNNKLQQEINGLPAEFILRKSAAYVLKETGKVFALKDQLPDNRKLHKIRIHLKAVIEILTVMNKLNATTGLDMLHNNFKIIDNKIGKWHDNIILLSSINYFANQNLMNRDVRHLINLTRRIESQQEERQQNIHGLINKYITQQPLNQIKNLL